MRREKMEAVTHELQRLMYIAHVATHATCITTTSCITFSPLIFLLGGAVGEPRIVTPEDRKRGRDNSVDRGEGGALVFDDGARGVITET